MSNVEDGSIGTELASRESKSRPQTADLGFVMDVPIELTVEIGRKTMKISDCALARPGLRSWSSTKPRASRSTCS